MNEEALGKKIKALRISNGLTQIQVAQALGVTPGYISNVENNRVAMSLRVLIYYAKLTGVTLDYLVGMVDSDYQKTALNNALKDRILKLTEEKKEKLMKTLDIWVD